MMEEESYIEYFEEFDRFRLHHQGFELTITPDEMKGIMETALFAVAMRYQIRKETTL